MAHHVIILASGKGLRLESKTPKQFLEIHSLPMIMHSMQAFFSAEPASKIYVALSKDYIGKWSKLCLKYKFQINHETYIGGNTRQESVFLGLKKIYNSFGESSKKHLVSIHDSARPFINVEFILELLTTAKKLGNAVPFVKLKSALRKIDMSTVLNSVAQNREDYIVTQTPQIFTFENIYSSYKYVVDSSMTNIFDDSAVYDYQKKKTRINLVKGREYNIKITTKLDYIIAQTIYQTFKDLK